MEFTRPATWEDLKRVARYLDEAGVAYALVGGYAVAAHGFNRFSEDIDLLVNPSAENSRRWIGALARLPDGAAAELAGEVEPHIREMEIDGVVVRVLDLPGLLKTKQGLRPKDRMDAAVIAATLKALGRDQE